MGTTLKFTINEARSSRPGNTAVLGRLTELMFMEILREYMQQLPEDHGGWLAGLNDPHVGKALRLLHASPMRNWTVEELSREAAISRSALAERFTQLVGEAPMRYLANWRMQLAKQLLREGTQSMSETNGMGPIPADDTIPVQVTDTVTRGTVKPTYAVAAYPHGPGGGDAIANGFVYRGKRIPALQGTLVFGDITTGRIWYAQLKEILAADDGNAPTLAPLHELSTQLRALSEATYRRRGGRPEGLPGRGAVAGAGRLDIRLAEDNDGELYVLTKGDGMIRELRSVR